MGLFFAHQLAGVGRGAVLFQSSVSSRSSWSSLAQSRASTSSTLRGGHSSEVWYAPRLGRPAEEEEDDEDEDDEDEDEDDEEEPALGFPPPPPPPPRGLLGLRGTPTSGKSSVRFRRRWPNSDWEPFRRLSGVSKMVSRRLEDTHTNGPPCRHR